MNIVSTNLNRRAHGSEEEQVYHLGWYPLALSSELKSGALIGRDFLGGRVVIYRDAAGKAVVQSGYCPHLGSDLSVGDLADGQLRCAFHHWSFDAAGKCVRIPAEGKIPPGARIFTYPSTEAWGLVWAFTGERPLFDLPRVPRLDEADVVYRTEMTGIVPFAPWLPTSNGLDFQHLYALHGMRITGPDTIDVKDYSIEYNLIDGDQELNGLITGTNTFSLYRSDRGDETFRLWTSTPLRHGETMAFSVIGMRDPRPRSDEERQAVERRLDGLTAYMAKLRQEDDRVLQSIRFRQGVLVAADRHLARYFKYAREFPCATFMEAC